MNSYIFSKCRVPTPPPRNYFPVAGDDHNDNFVDTSDDLDDDLSYTSLYNNRIDEIKTGWSGTTENYNNYYDDTTRYNYAEDTTKYSDGYNYDSTRYNYVADVTVRPTVQTQTSYYNNDQDTSYPDIWDGYSKVVQDLLRDKFYTNNLPGKAKSLQRYPV